MAHTRCLAGLILLALAVAVSADIRLQNVDRKVTGAAWSAFGWCVLPLTYGAQ